MKLSHVALGGALVGAGVSAFLTIVMVAIGLSSTAALVILAAQVLAAFAVVLLASRSDAPKRASRPQPPAQPLSQPPATASQPVGGSLEDMIIRLPNRPQPPTTAVDAVAQPPATAPQPPATAPQPQPQPQREQIILPFPLHNGNRREYQPRAEVPWQPAPWDVLLSPNVTAPYERDDSDDPPPATSLLPVRPPTAADYEVIRCALEECDGSRRRACVVVYGRRDGLTYPWLRKVADYWETSEIDRPSILVWELLGTRDIPGNLAARLGLDMTADQVSQAIDYAGLTRCQECEQWCILDELDENDACTKCTA